jgi:DNA-binding NarL/FixJ family response regulator
VAAAKLASHPEARRRPVPIVLVDDHPITRAGVRALLEETEFRIVGEAASGRQAPEIVRQARPRIVLLDICMADGDGLEALVALKRRFPSLAVLMLTAYDEPDFVSRAMAGGADGFLHKGVRREKLLDALRAIVQGHPSLQPPDDPPSFDSAIDQPAPEEPFEPLTPREEQVLRLLVTGRSNREIAEILFVADSTIKTHVQNITAKLGVSDRVQAAVWAVRRGICSRAD